MKTALFYFGCGRDKGHFLWETEGQYIHVFHDAAKRLGVTESVLKFIDGTYIPSSYPQIQGHYQLSIIGPCKIVAWHDYSVDSRSGSNSALIGTGFDSPESMIDAAILKFPSFMNRQPRPIPHP